MSGLGEFLSAPGFESEVAEAIAADANGDPWPLAILAYRSGQSEDLSGLVRARGIPAGTTAAEFVADVIAGRFAPTKKDRGLKRNMEILSVVSGLQYILVAKREGRLVTSGPAAEQLNTMDDVYRMAAEQFSLTSDGVKKLVQRNRRRQRRLAETTEVKGQ